MKIEIFHKNERLSVIEVTDTCILCHREKSSVFNPFHSDTLSSDDLNAFLKSRVFDPTRPDASELLAALGLSSFVPLEIAKKTHGILMSDNLWLRFDNEPFTWEDAHEFICAGK